MTFGETSLDVEATAIGYELVGEYRMGRRRDDFVQVIDRS
jgi:hypothetical protein